MEELFRSQFDSYTVDPSPGLWNKVRAKILWKQFFSFRFNTFNAYYLGGVLAIIAVGGYLITSSDKQSPAVNQEPVPAELSIEPTIQITEPGTQETGPEFKEPETGQESVLHSESGDVLPIDRKTAKEESRPIASEQKQSGTRKSRTVSEEVIEPTPQKKSLPGASVGFSVSQNGGCSPLAVQFTNMSENADAYHWTFGDGGSSSEEHPSYVFDEPGVFTVTLRMTAENGLEFTKQEVIQVFETPKALFEFDEDVSPSANQAIYFYNYSKSAHYYEWDFGDKQNSSLVDPVHYYEQPGSYHVKLTVWTENLCYDSLIIYNAFTSQENRIQLPTAFTPNLNGPSGGYYVEYDKDNTIFHPIIGGELIEYQMKIFNRIGVQIFESTDIQIGWDGYYQEQLAPQGVYIWKIRGKFSNGKTFVESGDVTLVKRY